MCEPVGISYWQSIRVAMDDDGSHSVWELVIFCGCG
jgi:hypothetical protein